MIYTALVCSDELSKNGPLIFSNRDARHLPMILWMHLAFLTILFGMWRLASYADPHLPHWMTEYAGRRGTIFNIVFILGMLGMHLVERKMLYVE